MIKPSMTASPVRPHSGLLQKTQPALTPAKVQASPRCLPSLLPISCLLPNCFYSSWINKLVFPFFSFPQRLSTAYLSIKILQNKERLLFSKPTKMLCGRKSYFFVFSRRTSFQSPAYSFQCFWGSRVPLCPNWVASCSWQMLEECADLNPGFHMQCLPSVSEVRWSEEEKGGKQASWLAQEGLLGWTISWRYFLLPKGAKVHNFSESSMPTLKSFFKSESRGFFSYITFAD